MIVNRTDNFYRIILSLIVNIFREELLSKQNLPIKPVVLFKSQTIKESKDNQTKLQEIIQNLNKKHITDTLALAKQNQESSPLLKMMLTFFTENQISQDILISKIISKIKPENILNVNDDKEKEKHQLILNSLEDYNNKIRIIFAVDKLNEGWDVLNLFDIVKLYNTKNPKTTVKEAQLIGRGARYYPFLFKDDDVDNKYKRKFDYDINNPLRCMEQLHYHTSDEVEFIKNLNKELEQSGLIVEDNLQEVNLSLKEEFINSDIYKQGIIILNKKLAVKKIKHIENSYKNFFEEEIKIKLPPQQYNVLYEINLKIEETEDVDKKALTSDFKDTTRRELSEINFPIFYKAISKNDFFNFDKLTYLGLNSVKDIYNHYAKSSITFLFDKKQQHKYLSPQILLEGTLKLLKKLEEDLQINEYQGSEFKINHAKLIKEVFTSKTILMPRNDIFNYNMQTVTSTYLAQSEFRGTSLENKLVVEIASYLEKRKDNFKEIFLIRNQGHFTIYNFKNGQGFQPDFVLFLQKQNGEILNYQLFIEPKGEHIAEGESWKEDFLNKINKKYHNFTIDGKRKQIIKGLPFYNEDNITNFIKQLEDVLAKETSTEITQ